MNQPAMTQTAKTQTKTRAAADQALDPTQTATVLPFDLSRVKTHFDTEGYAVVEGLFSPAEVAELQQTFADIHAAGPVPGLFSPASEEEAGGDPLKRYPRVMMPHRFNAVSERALLHPKVMTCLETLFGEAALAAQTMFYFKPPGAKGQALHQDNFFLLVEPNTCIAAWTAVDDIDEENGGMFIVPKTQAEAIVCPEEADAAVSFTTHYVPVPEGRSAKLAQMKAGDTLFFNGNTIHGSGPNHAPTRFRRSFIGHYVPASTERISHHYLPLLTRDGEEVVTEVNSSGGACGEEWQGSSH